MAVEGLKGASVAADIIMWVITTIVFRDYLEVQFLYYTQEGFGSKFLRSTSFLKTLGCTSVTFPIFLTAM